LTENPWGFTFYSMRYLLIVLGLLLASPVWASDARLCSDAPEGIEAILTKDGETMISRYDDPMQGVRKFLYANQQTGTWTLVTFPLGESNIAVPVGRVASYCVVQSGTDFVLIQP